MINIIISFTLGLVAGVIIMCIVQINRDIEENNKSFEEKYNDLIIEELKETFTYDCLNDEENKHIPRID